jgi:hypothetical protein
MPCDTAVSLLQCHCCDTFDTLLRRCYDTDITLLLPANFLQQEVLTALCSCFIVLSLLDEFVVSLWTRACVCECVCMCMCVCVCVCVCESIHLLNNSFTH